MKMTRKYIYIFLKESFEESVPYSLHTVHDIIASTADIQHYFYSYNLSETTKLKIFSAYSYIYQKNNVSVQQATLTRNKETNPNWIYRTLNSVHEGITFPL